MSHVVEGAVETVDSVSFSFFTNEKVRKHSVVKITKPDSLDGMGRAVLGGLYDPTMGAMSDNEPCKTCGQRSSCPGHCGHIDLVSVVYNPLLFNTLYKILRKTCFFCHHFTESRTQVDLITSQLELIAKGDIIGAKKLGFSWLADSSEGEGGDISCSSESTDYCGDSSVSEKSSAWTSLQLNEEISVLNTFLKSKFRKFTKCENCKARNPNIKKPNFGCFNVTMRSDQARANSLKGIELQEVLIDGVSDANSQDTGGGYNHLALDGAQSSGGASGVITSNMKNKHKVESSRGGVKLKSTFTRQLLPSEVKVIMERLWENESKLCSFINDIQHQGFGKNVGASMFFLETILVPPIKFRPLAKRDETLTDHQQTLLLKKVLQSNVSLGNAHSNQSPRGIIITRWNELQQSVNCLFDSKTGKGPGKKDEGSGICQLLEKKEGIFRQNMMGKRVNFACRSVISPDPYLAVNEIGIPPFFALRLTYPERVTPWNMNDMRKAIVNGPGVHPGATHYMDKSTVNLLPANVKGRISISRKLPSLRGVDTQVRKSTEYESDSKIVYRHIRDGDIVLVNRQPTLHKPSIMAHVVRVLKGEKTLRMHYANCSTYNADFDGDEMNVHFPQDDISRAEAYNIVNANKQYVKPTNGFPIRALIQDHVVSAAILTKKDTFLSYNEFVQLFYSSGVFTSRTGLISRRHKKVSIAFEDNWLCPAPAIWKPEPLWTGKQVISAVLESLTRGFPPFTVEKQGRVPSDFFKRKTREESKKSGQGNETKLSREKNSRKKDADKDKVTDSQHQDEHNRVNKKKSEEPGEETILILNNYLISGVIDKSQFGDYGLVHTVQELYGSNTAGILLSALSRLFTGFLQMHGFTCGVDDLLLRKEVDDRRKQQLEDCEKCGKEVHCEVVGLKNTENLDPVELQMKIEEVICSNGESALTSLDRRMISKLNELSSKKIDKDLLSEGLLKPTGKNCISLMTTSGAKGGTANFQQISSHLGQQELEGKRVPRMISGKTLPCFLPWDWAARAGGFVIDRFLSGLHPQEYYFHCMAGRDGLVDTAVKTSRSGYLQRCLIKNLECLKVGYDRTVRDADGSIVQFLYGEDGIDVHKTSFVAKFDALSLNQDVVNIKRTVEHQMIDDYIQDLPASLKDKAINFIHEKSKRGVKSLKVAEADVEDFMKSVKHKYFSSLAQPGEPVGLLAAQSVGEPSTQMTLNTFHHAGRGEMNVTLGIPRLQEILMAASSEIKTPIMTCPFRTGTSKDSATRLAEKFKRITIADIIENLEVSLVPFAVDKNCVCRIYKLKMRLNVPKFCTVEQCSETLEGVYLRKLEDAIHSHIHLISTIRSTPDFQEHLKQRSSRQEDEASVGDASEITNDKNLDNDVDDDVDGDDSDDLSFDGQKYRNQLMDEVEYDNGDEAETNEPGQSVGYGSDVDEVDGHESTSSETARDEDIHEEVSMSPLQSESPISKSKNKKQNKNQSEGAEKTVKRAKKGSDRSFYVATDGGVFEVHFKFTYEPHILLAQIAQQVAKKVYMRNTGSINSCQVVTCKESQVLYYGDNPRTRVDVGAKVKESIPALQTSGVDFGELWKKDRMLDIRYIYSNNIHAILNTYGVEAAREVIMREVQHVFRSYGISVDIRHLTLIADFMTQMGGYRPMNRLGAIAESISPFSKMTFETATKFIVEAALRAEVDFLETPSARICLGKPVKLGTGSFDILQKIEV
ncbi:hypothetical protein MLD38_033187 [Melastoma candidum]|uniref:Uncharacterized protein n=1 Tax=Melastoma candidum TaxID=119954 RepID=A0ACB9M802_9MYRT|nr:hypothetical protein MLD38_033187 [Melastoma candidum]